MPYVLAIETIYSTLSGCTTFSTSRSNDKRRQQPLSSDGDAIFHVPMCILVKQNI